MHDARQFKRKVGFDAVRTGDTLASTTVGRLRMIYVFILFVAFVYFRVTPVIAHFRLLEFFVAAPNLD